MEPINRFSAWLSGDLPIPAEEAYQRFVIAQFREEVAEELAEGIRGATYVSTEKLREMLESPRFCKWSRVLEAVARRTEPLPLELASLLLSLGSDDKNVLVPLLHRNLEGGGVIAEREFRERVQACISKADAAFEEFAGVRHG